MRLIDVDTIQWTANGCGHPNCKDICDYTKDDGTCCGWLVAHKKDVDNLPTVDAVPREEYERVCKERDAAVSDLVMCMHFSTKNNNVCNFCKKDMAEYPNKCAGWSDSCECKPEWRGISKEEADGQSIL